MRKKRIAERILDLLSDGERHSAKESIEKCFDDELTTKRALQTQIYLTKRLIPEGHEIVCVVRDYTHWYQHIVKLNGKSKDS